MITENGQLLTEDVTIIYSYCREQDMKDQLSDIVELCKYIKLKIPQEAITLEYEGKVKFRWYLSLYFDMYVNISILAFDYFEELLPNLPIEILPYQKV